ncbi:MAG: NAD-dependent epimerase/dehydratase family protein [Candidatus Binatia bacterium]
MVPKTVLLTGGAGFVGATLALHLKAERPATRVIALDNLRRRGGELNLPRLKAAGVEFVHGDVRNPEDLDLPPADLVIECSAEPSVLAGYAASPEYVLRTNLVGTLNVLEYCRRQQAALLFLSTSRVYPLELLRAIRLLEGPARFEIAREQACPGISAQGVGEAFPLTGARSLYGATKLASELFIEEYREAYGIRAVINRCGVLAGPWQMGKVDQGVVVLWVARHVYGGALSYIGFSGSGKQVRDVLHIADLCELVALQIAQLETLDGQVLNVGGGPGTSISLLELTDICERVTGNRIHIDRVPQDRHADVPLYISDISKIRAVTRWTPTRSIEDIVRDIFDWIRAHQTVLASILDV